ncbi:MAG: hypothetical protein KBI35_01725 [Ruminococcus sp.]|nr:hypothetical protein [Ruminococcus sp.]
MKPNIYKREIPNSSDWKTDTDNQMINGFRELMAYNNQFQDNPQVGIFWYDVERNELFGVIATDAIDTQYSILGVFDAPARTCKSLHCKVWQRVCCRDKDRRFSGDYTQVPRGRVFQIKDKGFVVCVGSWINDYPQAKAEILYEFQLPEDTEFKIDSHWELGHGWSDKDL